MTNASDPRAYDNAPVNSLNFDYQPAAFVISFLTQLFQTNAQIHPINDSNRLTKTPDPIQFKKKREIWTNELNRTLTKPMSLITDETDDNWSDYWHLTLNRWKYLTTWSSRTSIISSLNLQRVPRYATPKDQRKGGFIRPDWNPEKKNPKSSSRRRRRSSSRRSRRRRRRAQKMEGKKLKNQIKNQKLQKRKTEEEEKKRNIPAILTVEWSGLTLGLDGNKSLLDRLIIPESFDESRVPRRRFLSPIFADKKVPPGWNHQIKSDGHFRPLI